MKGLQLSLLLVAATAVLAVPIEKRSAAPNDIVFVQWGQSVSPPPAEETENKNIIFYGWGKEHEGNPPETPPMHAHKAHRGKDNNGNDIVFVNWGTAAEEKNLKDYDDDPKGDIVFVGWGYAAEGESNNKEKEVDSDIVFVGWGK